MRKGVHNDFLCPAVFFLGGPLVLLGNAGLDR